MSNGINQRLVKHLRMVIEEKENFPIGVLAYFGPDDQRVTKTVAVIIPGKERQPIHKSWFTEDLENDSKLAIKIGQYFLENGVNEVVMTDGVVGCPHDEGIDYPAGQLCPYCPYWAEKQDE